MGTSHSLPASVLPAYVTALVANYREVEPPPVKRQRGGPRRKPKRRVAEQRRYAQVDKRRRGGRLVEVRRRIIFGQEGDIEVILQATGCGSQINTAYVERNHLTMRQNVGRLVRQTLSFSKSAHYLQRHIWLADAVYNFVKPHRSLRQAIREGDAGRRKWEHRTPAMAAGLTDHSWTIAELLEFRA